MLYALHARHSCCVRLSARVCVSRRFSFIVRGCPANMGLQLDWLTIVTNWGLGGYWVCECRCGDMASFGRRALALGRSRSAQSACALSDAASTSAAVDVLALAPVSPSPSTLSCNGHTHTRTHTSTTRAHTHTALLSLWVVVFGTAGTADCRRRLFTLQFGESDTAPQRLDDGQRSRLYV